MVQALQEGGGQRVAAAEKLDCRCRSRTQIRVLLATILWDLQPSGRCCQALSGGAGRALHVVGLVAARVTLDRLIQERATQPSGSDRKGRHR